MRANYSANFDHIIIIINNVLGASYKGLDALTRSNLPKNNNNIVKLVKLLLAYYGNCLSLLLIIILNNIVNNIKITAVNYYWIIPKFLT